jgi:hypothetical protein
MNEQVQELRTGDDSTDKLRGCPGIETDATRDDTPFDYVPGQMTKLLNPKSLGGWYAMGGLPALERGLRTSLNRSLPGEESITDSSVTFDEAVITAMRAGLFEAGSPENCEKTSNHDRPMGLYPVNISQLIRTTNDRMALILLTASAVLVLALECFRSIQLHPGEEQERIESDREAAKPTYGTISDRIDVPTTSMMNPPWMRVASSVRNCCLPHLCRGGCLQPRKDCICDRHGQIEIFAVPDVVRWLSLSFASQTIVTIRTD